jgi:hypothetical protein
MALSAAWGQSACASGDADSISMGAATLGDFGTSEADVAELKRSFRNLPRNLWRLRGPIICLPLPRGMAGRDPDSRQKRLAIRSHIHLDDGLYAFRPGAI